MPEVNLSNNVIKYMLYGISILRNSKQISDQTAIKLYELAVEINNKIENIIDEDLSIKENKPKRKYTKKNKKDISETITEEKE